MVTGTISDMIIIEHYKKKHFISQRHFDSSYVILIH